MVQIAAIRSSLKCAAKQKSLEEKGVVTRLMDDGNFTRGWSEDGADAGTMTDGRQVSSFVKRPPIERCSHFGTFEMQRPSPPTSD